MICDVNFIPNDNDLLFTLLNNSDVFNDSIIIIFDYIGKIIFTRSEASNFSNNDIHNMTDLIIENIISTYFTFYNFSEYYDKNNNLYLDNININNTLFRALYGTIPGYGYIIYAHVIPKRDFIFGAYSKVLNIKKNFTLGINNSITLPIVNFGTYDVNVTIQFDNYDVWIEDSNSAVSHIIPANTSQEFVFYFDESKLGAGVFSDTIQLFYKDSDFLGTCWQGSDHLDLKIVVYGKIFCFLIINFLENGSIDSTIRYVFVVTSFVIFFVFAFFTIVVVYYR